MSDTIHRPIRGVLAPVLTPFEDDERIALDLYVDFASGLLANGCAGLVPFGTTGEAQSAGVRERLGALEALVESGIDPRQLLPGTGLCNFAETLELTSAAERLGCRGALVLPPFYYKGVSEDGLYAWFARLAESVRREDFGIYLYHIPQVAGVGVPVGVARRLAADFPGRVAGAKDSSGDWDNTVALLEVEGFSVYPGNEMRLADSLALGAPGCITASANLNASAIAQIVSLHDRGEDTDSDMARVRAWREALQEYAPIPGMKRILADRTGDGRWAYVRPPLQAMDSDRGSALQVRLDGLA